MGKQEIKQRETQVSTNGGVGKQVEQTYTIDDNCLPSPQELEAYKAVDPKIVEFLITSSVKEQEHRHKTDDEKIKLLAKADRREWLVNWWGMFFAFLSIVVLVALTGFALYLDKPWFAGIMGLGTFISIASIFIKGKEPHNPPKPTKKQ